MGVVAGLAAAAATTHGCFSERLAPPTFRYACTDDTDCEGRERCIDALCQVPCTQATFMDDCAEGGTFALCLNGVCSSPCLVDQVECPGAQTCLDLGIDLSDLIGSGGFGRGASPEGPIGVCGVLCEGNDACPDGEVCLSGFCVATCTTSAECSFGFSCVAGLCIPGDGDDGPDEPSTADGAGSATGDTTGGETTDGQTEESGTADGGGS